MSHCVQVDASRLRTLLCELVAMCHAVCKLTPHGSAHYYVSWWACTAGCGHLVSKDVGVSEFL